MSDPKKPIVHDFRPKSVFLDHGEKSDKDFIQQISVDQRFERVLSYAYAQWASECPENDPTVARQVHGVNRFIRTLKALGDPKLPPPARIQDHLTPPMEPLSADSVR